MARKFLQSVVLILSFIFIFSGKSPSQLIQNDIIINEWYLNPVSSEGKEFVEIVVLKQDADLRNIRLSDVDTKGGAGSTTEGHLTFPNSSYLTNIPLGTIIVCVLETPLPNGNLFEQDTNYADGKMVLFSGGLPGGVLIASGRMDISQNENIVLLTNDASDATTLDFIATGNNTVQSNYPDAVWSNNLSAGTGGTVTYFTNSSSNGLNNDNGQIGWQVNKLSTSKSPAARNPGQTLPSVNFPPVIVSVSRLPYIPQAGANDTVYSQITDDGGVAEALLRYRINDGGENTVTMVLTSGTFRDGLYRGVIPSVANTNEAKVEYYIYTRDNSVVNPLITESSLQGYFAGTSTINVNGIKLSDNNGRPIYAGYGVRVRATATVSAGQFSTTDLDAYVQDENGGINMYLSGALPSLTVNNAYFVSGTIGQQNGRTQITTPEFTVEQTSPPYVPIPSIITIGQYLNNPELYEGKLIRFQQCSKVSGTWPSQGNDAQLVITDGTGTTTLYLDGNTNISNYSEPSYPKNFTGVAYQNDTQPPYFSNYGLMMRTIGDISVGQPNQSPVVSQVTRTIAVPHAGESDTVFATITDDGDVSFVYLVYIVNDIQRDSVLMYDISKRKSTGKKQLTYQGILPGNIHQNGNRLRVFVRAIDDGNPPLMGTSAEQKYVAGVIPISQTGLKRKNVNGELYYSEYAVRVRGRVTVGSNTFSNTDVDVYLQDDSGGVRIYNPGEGGTFSFIEEAAYEVSGTLKQIQGMTNILPPYFSVQSSSFPTVIEPKPVRLSQLFNQPEQYEGSLVKIQLCEYYEGFWPPAQTDGEITFFTPEAMFGKIFLDGNSDFALNQEPVWPIDVTGVIVQHGDNLPDLDKYKIHPRRYLDIVEVPRNDPPGPFELLEPNDNAQISFVHGEDETKLRWSSSLDPEQVTVQYKVVFAQDFDFLIRLDSLISENGGGDTTVAMNGIFAQELLNRIGSPQSGGVFWRVYATDGLYEISSNHTFSLQLSINNTPPQPFGLMAPNNTSQPFPDSSGAPPIPFTWEQANDLDESDFIKYYMKFAETPSFTGPSVYVPQIGQAGDSLLSQANALINRAVLKSRYLTSGRDSVVVYWMVYAMDGFYQSHATPSTDTFQILLHRIPPGWVEHNGVIINEFSTNPNADGGKEYIELLVAKRGVVDLRGVRITDVQTKNGPGTSAEGHLNFPMADYLYNLAPCTRIIVVLSTPLANPNILSQDLNPSDSTLVLFSSAIPGGVLDTVGTFDLDANDNIALLRGQSSDALTLDYVATGNNASYINYSDAKWITNLTVSDVDKVTYFTNSPRGKLNNDSSALGWQPNQANTFRTPGRVNLGQQCGTINDTPPEVVTYTRSPFVPLNFGRDTVLLRVRDNNDVDSAWIIYSVNDGQFLTLPMTRTSSDSIQETWRFIFSDVVNVPGNRVWYYARIRDNSGLVTLTQQTGYFAGTTPIALSTIRNISEDGVANYAGYAVRVHGTATVADHVFALNRLDSYIQDDSGGVNIFAFSNEGGDTIRIQEGYPYTVEGTLIQFRGKVEISVPNLKIKQEGAFVPIQPRSISIGEWQAHPEFYEGMLLRFTNVYKDSGTWPTPGSFSSLRITDSSGLGIMFLDNDTDIDDVPEPQYPISVVGIGSQFAGSTSPPFTSGYQIIPRRRSDITAPGAPLGFNLQIPENGGRLVFNRGDETNLFVWDAALDTNQDPITYRVLYSRDSNFIQIFDTIRSDQNGTLASAQLSGIKAESYLTKVAVESLVVYWKVLASDGANVTSSNQFYSVKFVIPNKPSRPFSLVSPPRNTREIVPDTAGTPSLTVRWGRSSELDPLDTVRYYVLFSENTSFADTTLYSPNLVGNTLNLTLDTTFNVSRQALRQKYLATRDSVRVYWRVHARDIFGYTHDIGSRDTFTLILKRSALGIEEINTGVPREYFLTQNFPNPFNPATEIQFGLPTESYVALKIYNVLGREVATLLSHQLAGGAYKIEWDATGVASGIYFYRLEARENASSVETNFSQTKKLILLK